MYASTIPLIDPFTAYSDMRFSRSHSGHLETMASHSETRIGLGCARLVHISNLTSLRSHAHLPDMQPRATQTKRRLERSVSVRDNWFISQSVTSN